MLSFKPAPPDRQLPAPRPVPGLDAQYADLIDAVSVCERRTPRPWVWLGSQVVAVGRHVCRPPELPFSYGRTFDCPCGQGWKQELGGGWTTRS